MHRTEAGMYKPNNRTAISVTHTARKQSSADTGGAKPKTRPASFYSSSHVTDNHTVGFSGITGYEALPVLEKVTDGKNSTAKLRSVKSSPLSGNHNRQENATFIEVIKELTPSFTYKEPSSYPLLSIQEIDNNQTEPSQEHGVHTERVSQRKSTAYYKDTVRSPTKRERTTSERSSLTTSTTSQCHSDSGYETGGRNSSTTSSHSLETSHEIASHERSSHEKPRSEQSTQVSTLLQGITTLTKNAQQDSIHAQHSPTSYPLDDVSNDRLSHSCEKNNPRANELLDLDLKRSVDIRKDYKSFTSPQGSPVTPRRFKSPDCIRTKGIDFEEKWTFFEVITSPPEEFRDMLPSLEPGMEVPSLREPKPNTSAQSEAMQTEPLTDGKEITTVGERKMTLITPAKIRMVDLNNNIVVGQSPTGSPSAVRRPYRAVRKIHRPKQNAQTNTDNVITIEAEVHQIAKPKVSPILSRLSPAASPDKTLKICSNTSGKIVKYNGNSLVSKNRGVIMQDTASKAGNTCGSKTSPVLKRLFSTTMDRGLQIYTDWANHYLEKARSDRRVDNLQRDLSDGVLLAYIVQSVTNRQLDGINYNPKNSTQMLNNLTNCIEFLRLIGVNVDELTAKEIKDGNLKCVLGLFFNLSRFKQQQKQATAHQHQHHSSHSHISAAGAAAGGHSDASSDMTSRIPGSGLRPPSHKSKLSAPGSSNGRIPTGGVVPPSGVAVISANKRSGLQPPGQRQSNGSTISSRSSSPIGQSSISAPGSKLAAVSNGTYGRISRKAVDNSPSNQSLSSSGVSSVKSSHNGIATPTSKSQVPPSASGSSQSASPGVLDKLFKSKKSAASPKTTKSEEKVTKPTSAKKEKVVSSKVTKKEDSKIAKPPISSIPRGGSLSSRSRTPSRENLAKCRINPPGGVSGITKPGNRLSSDSGIHSPAESKSDTRESGLVRNNSLPSSRIHSVKDSALNRQTALRASTNSPTPVKKDARSLPKALLSYSKSGGDGTKGSQSQDKSKTDTSGGLRLKIPPPLPSSLPPPSSSNSNTQDSQSNSSSAAGKTVYNQLPGVSHYIRPNSTPAKVASSTTSVSSSTGASDKHSPYQSNDDINRARKLQAQQQAKQNKVEMVTQTDTSALQKIAHKTESRHSPPKETKSKTSSSTIAQPKAVVAVTNSSGSSSGAGPGISSVPSSGSSVHILPGQKTSQAKIKSLASKGAVNNIHSGTDSSSSSLNHNSSASSNDSVIYRPDVQGEETPNSQARAAASLLRKAKVAGLDEKTDDGAGNDFQVEAMQPLDKLASYEFLQRLGRSGGISHTPSQQHQYKSPLSRFSHMNRSFNTKSANKHIHEDYASDAECYTNGYLSDAGTPSRGSSDYADYSGYLSEGGASMYARKMQQRFREGMQLVQECLSTGGGSKYPDVDDDSFDEDDASSVSSGDISDTLDLVDTPDPESSEFSSQGTDHYLKSRLNNSLSTPYKQSNTGFNSGDNMRDRTSGGRVPLSLTRSSVSASAGGYMSDSGCSYSITEQCLAEQQRAKGLISSKTQQSLQNSKQDELYKCHTLGRNRNMSGHDPRSYALMNGPPAHHMANGNGAYMRPPACGGVDGSGTPPVWVMQPGSMGNRRSLGSESDSGLANGDRCMGSPMMSGRSMSTSNGHRSVNSRQMHSMQQQQQHYPTNHHNSSSLQEYYFKSLPRNVHGMIQGSVGSSLYSHIHQGGYESDSGVVERRALCSQCCQPIAAKDTTDMRGSQISLNSTTSSMYSTAEERQTSEVLKLRKELDRAKDQVFTLTSQLTTNAHVVQAFEQSLGNMTMRLQHLQSKSEQKDTELIDMKSTIDNLRRMTGLAHTEILQNSQNHALNLHTTTTQHKALERQMSADSISSLNSMSSIGSTSSSAVDGKKKGKKNWIRNSFSKAFSKKKNSTGGGSMSDVEGDSVSHYSDASGNSVTSAPTTPTHAPSNRGAAFNIASYLYADVEDMSPEAIAEMKRMLREKEMKLTDIRLDALTSAHQLEQLRDAMGKMKQEMSYLKADNDRLHRMVGDGPISPTATSASMPPSSPLSNGPSISGGISLLSTSFSQAGSPTASLGSPVHRSFGPPDKSSLDFLSSHGLSSESDSGKRVTISVVSEENKQAVGCFIGSISVTGKTKWDVLDSIVKRTFKQYLSRIDQSTNLGLTSESIHAFIVGEVYRTKDGDTPELLPYGYLVGETTNIKIILKGADHNSVDSLAFETGIPKSIIQRYASLLSEHKRIILSGPTGTGKSHLAQHLAGHLISRSGKPRRPHSVATFDGEHKSSKELREYLCSIQDQCENCDVESLPTVIILDNLHHVSSLGDVFSGFLSHKSAKCPYIIGTMSQSTNATTNLQLHHNFRWVLCANHMEPVKGFLGRYLRRKLVASEVSANILNNDLGKIIEWIPKVWQHVNKFIETHNSTEATIGPRQFLDCPMDITQAQIWFTQLWNYSLIPYLREAIKEGLQKYGQKSGWEDPTDWLIQTYPWSLDTADLLHLRAEDVGYDKQLPATSPTSNSKSQTNNGKESSNKDSSGRDVDPVDPLYNMIMRLREQSSYNGQADNESLESHSSAILDTA